MARIIQCVTDEWLAYVKLHTKADFDKGLLYWAIPMRGRKMHRPIGCCDNNGYIKTQIANRATYVHSVIYYLGHGIWPKMIDHINQVRHDNRLCNLRETDYSQNALNVNKWRTNTSGVKGVSLTPYGKYKVTKQGRYLGTFSTLEEAADAYNSNS